MHLEHTRGVDNPMSKACASMAKFASNSSNLAALCLHVSCMTQDLQNMIQHEQSQANTSNSDFTDRITLVGKAQEASGALNLLRILFHDVEPSSLPESLQYRDRADGDSSNGKDGKTKVNADVEIVTSLLNYISTVTTHTLEKFPEVYDATVMVLQLLLVLLSSQLYNPMVTSIERKQEISAEANYVLDLIMNDARGKANHQVQPEGKIWSPHLLLKTCLGWQINRPYAPDRSIAHYTSALVQSVAATGEKTGPDGMYETHLIAMAKQPDPNETVRRDNFSNGDENIRNQISKRPSKILVDATKLGLGLLLLPFRLMTLALGLLSRRSRNKHEYDALRKQHLQRSKTKGRTGNRVNEVLWISESPVADLSTALLLLLVHNYRAGNNPFRSELAALNDKRWEDVNEVTPAITSDYTSTGERKDENDADTNPLLAEESCDTQQQHLMTNFESLFKSCGSIAHTEIGAMLLYTMYQSSPIFAASMAVRSDLDTVVVPLLRTLYFASSSKFYAGNAGKIATKGGTESIRNLPFRSLSQLYLNLILLLLFSQDSSFGPDIFRRTMLSTVPWYRERNFKNVTLGSLLLLTLLRSITFNLNRLQDVFLLSNCCAIMMNISPHIVNLHDYAAMRLTFVTIATLKKYSLIVARKDGNEEDLSTPMGMYGEVVRTLIGLLRHCLSPRSIRNNIHLIYALVYHQADFREVSGKTTLKMLEPDLLCVEKIIKVADQVIHDDGDARTAIKAHKVLEANIENIMEVSENVQEADFTFSYEEEADPEIFFVPYMWEIIVCVISASTIDWDVNRIKSFPLLEEELDMDGEESIDDSTLKDHSVNNYPEDISDVV